MSVKRPDPVDIEVGHRIRIERLARGLSQTALASQIGVTFQQVQKYEQGVNRVGAGRLARIAEVLAVPVAFFFDGAAGPKPTAGRVHDAVGLVRTAGAMRLAPAFAAMPAGAAGPFVG